MSTRGQSRQDALRQEAIDAARGLAAGDEALVVVLRDLERERSRALPAVIRRVPFLHRDENASTRRCHLAVHTQLSLDNCLAI